MIDLKTPIDIAQYKAEDFAKELKDTVKLLEATRAGSNKNLPVEISLNEFVQSRYGLSKEAFIDRLGISTKTSTMQNIYSMPGTDYRWIVPEIIRDALTLGMNTAPFYPNMIASDQPINGLNAIMPFINPSDAAPARINEGETIPLGTVSFGQKDVRLFKIGKGIKITDEVKNYVSLDILSIFLRDFGTQMGYAMDGLAIDALINGNKADGSEAAPAIGVKTTGSIVYRDLLKLWIRAARLGRNFQTIVGGEDVAIDLLDLPEFKDKKFGTTEATLNLKSPVPNKADFFIHSGIASDQILLIDPKAALIKLTAKNLMLESERIVSNQTEAIYASLTTGFSKMYQDAAILMDHSVAFSSWPAFFDIDSQLNVVLE